MSNETKWTPGPWFFNDGCDIVTEVVIGSKGICSGWRNEEYLSIDITCEDGGEEKKLANAHLIAAAPELYDALSLMVEQFDADNGHDFLNEADYLAVKSAKSAMAKARGEQ